MKKIFLIIFLTFLFLCFSQKTYPYSKEDVAIEEFSNDPQCLNTVNMINESFLNTNTVAVLSKDQSVLVGISTDKNAEISKEQIEKIVYKHFPVVKKLKIEVNTKRAEDIMELSYFSSGSLKKRYISLRFDFLISED